MTEKFIMIASSKGGVGKSTAALGISRALKEKGYKVLLCDLDFGNACLDMLLGVQDSVLYTVQDVAAGRTTADKALIPIDDGSCKKRKKRKKGITMPEGALWLLSSAVGGGGCVPTLVGEGGLCESSVCSAVTDAARAVSADYVIIDTGAGINSAVEAAATLSDTALVVTGHMPVALRSAQTTVDRLSRLGVKDIRLIINSFDADGVIDDDRRGLFSVIDESRAPLVGVVPYDYRLMLAHEKLLGAGGEAETAFSNIAARLEGERVPVFFGIKRLRKLKKKICL